MRRFHVNIAEALLEKSSADDELPTFFFSFISQTQSRSHCRPINVLSRLQRLDEVENLSQQRTMNDAKRKKERKSRPIAMVVDDDSDVK